MTKAGIREKHLSFTPIDDEKQAAIDAAMDRIRETDEQ